MRLKVLLETRNKIVHCPGDSVRGESVRGKVSRGNCQFPIDPAPCHSTWTLGWSYRP